MSRLPPLLPEETYLRVLRLARFDGLGVLFVAGFFALVSALGADRLGAFIGLFVAGAGAMELHGAGLLEHGERRGMNWLINSQLFLMLTILAYCEYLLSHPNYEFWRSGLHAWQESLPPDARQQMQGDLKQMEAMIPLLSRLSCVLVAIATVLYQGGMVWYYSKRRKAVAQALEFED